MSIEVWASLSWQAWLTLGVIASVLTALALTRVAADVVLVASVTVLLLAGVLTTEQAFAGLANEGVLTVAVLYVVVAGLEATGGSLWIMHRVLGQPRSIAQALWRLTVPVTGVSAFLNNTPVVAMLLPAVSAWSRRCRIPASKLMMPLSYAAVLGGCCTLIGTSTNLVVNGLLIAARGPQASLGLFDPLWVGLPCAGAGLALLIVGHRWLLPVRRPAISEISDPREYTVEMIVDPAGPLVGRTIEAAGLRHLPRCFLAEIERQGEVLAAVGPQERLRGGDRLVFVGVVDSVVDLQRFHGLLPATNQVFKLDAPRPERCLIETVVAPHCPIVGQTIRDGRFRTRYNAVVIAVARSGQRINRKIGDIVLQPGDNLLLEAHPQVVEQVRHARDFYLVSEIADSAPPRHERAILAALIMLAMVLVASFEYLSMLQAALLAAGAMVVTRCCTLPQARRAVDWQVLIAIAASFALGRALESSGLAAALADTLAGLAAGSPWLALVVVYGLTLLLTEVVTNNAAAVLAFPIGLRLAEQMDVSATPFVLAVMLAASLGFATPLGYQTHLMVYGPGGYRLADFLRAGVPLDLICWAVAVIVLPLAFPF